MEQRNDTRYPVHEVITQRWSPYGFSDRAVRREDVLSVFEAASWAASSFNEQPWRFMLATKENPAEFEKMLGCLVEANQGWAKVVPVLSIGITKSTFTRNDKPNRVALHDLGLAAANLTFEATARGLCVHQMGGVDREKTREVYNVPDGYEVQTAIAIGYAADPQDVPEALRERDAGPRTRRPLTETVFGGTFGEPAAEVR